MQRILLGLVALTACQHEQSPRAQDLGASLPVDPPASVGPGAPGPATAGRAGFAAAPTTAANAISGTVVETMGASTYTYARLDHDGAQIWVAGPETKLVVGAKVGPLTGTLMTGFRSETLKRTFDEIYFVNTYGQPVPLSHSTATATATADNTERIAPAPGGKTVADVFVGSRELAGKAVIVRGKIVKVNNDILDRNWLHLRDGTGASGKNDLLITTKAIAKPGDVVVVHGTVGTNRDFGGTYRYDVLIENATITNQ